MTRSSQWYHDPSEENFWESILVVIFVALALLFDFLYESLAHHLKHSYFYGQQGSGHDEGMHKVLALELLRRAGAEFMTLGFLALAIFIFGQAGGFAALAAWSQNTPSPSPSPHVALWSTIGSATTEAPTHDQHIISMPQTEADWLHLFEFVHIKIFLGMCLYFILISFIVAGGARKIRDWEAVAMRRFATRGLGTRSYQAGRFDKDLKDYQTWRKAFIDGVIGWKHSRPAVYREVVDALGLSLEAECQTQAVLEEKHFFTSYLAFAVEDGVCDCITVHHSCWLSLMLLFSIFAVFEITLQFTILDITPIFVLVAIAVLMSMRCVLGRRTLALNAEPEITSSVDIDPLDAASVSWLTSELRGAGLNQTTHSEAIVMRIMEVALFTMSYAFSSTLLDFNGWQAGHLPWTLFICMTMAFFYALLGYFLPSLVPDFLATMALPPYVDEQDLNQLMQILKSTNTHITGSFYATEADTVSLSLRAAAHKAFGKRDEELTTFTRQHEHMHVLDSVELAALHKAEEGLEAMRTALVRAALQRQGAAGAVHASQASSGSVAEEDPEGPQLQFRPARAQARPSLVYALTSDSLGKAEALQRRMSGGDIESQYESLGAAPQDASAANEIQLSPRLERSGTSS